MFQKINNEKNELIHFETLISEVSKQEGISFSDACAVIAREASWHLEDVPFNEPFYLYDYDVINGFRKSDSFSKQSINFLTEMALGADFAEESNPDAKGVYSRIDGGNGWHREFFFKGTEITISFLDTDVTLPPCLEKFRMRAERLIKIKKERLAKERAKEGQKEISRDELEKEIERLNAEVKKLLTELPCQLGEFRDDDPLLIAIQLRNSEWSSYDEDDRKTIPSQEALVTQLKQQYQKMPDAQARAIEKVACPIKRK
ncbi:hypothetical protein G5B34_13090 [Enterobacter hormaechei]|uniref:hypothetical protein n=1 Tax=Enterobacter hormaechei TaxID=158836 RepID=UPI0013DF52D6|nr:hypothetical protein [Enterobacter hormaechei]HCM9177200.1 hypothetical protein [Enterobacter hormaechei subsp. steigerwaltii]MCM7340204.1 hypothetical protein [Enterobacter hormaechei]MCM7361466.1 hypothetical protein [Enterobacter hormaechei]MDA4799586.1 hypothetical protein [Enterobacter hormaechei]QIE66792.1 hypothetical protein G5B34_13090 [Enterobacter hormaechei]